jgi:hypothetical protein
MHPILGNRSWLLLYLAGWLMVGVLLGAVLNLADPRTLAATATFVVPLLVIYSSVCLSAWYVCRAAPLGRSELGTLLGTVVCSAIASSALWIALWGCGRAWSAGIPATSRSCSSRASALSALSDGTTC